MIARGSDFKLYSNPYYHDMVQYRSSRTETNKSSRVNGRCARFAPHRSLQKTFLEILRRITSCDSIHLFSALNSNCILLTQPRPGIPSYTQFLKHCTSYHCHNKVTPTHQSTIMIVFRHRAFSSRIWKLQHSQLASKFGHERCNLSTLSGGQCAILPIINNSHSNWSSQHSRNVSEGTNASLQELQWNPFIISQLMQKIQCGQEDAFYVVDLHALEKRYQLWNKHLPFVKPFYAVKCNPDQQLLQTLAHLGCGFDCASRAEIDAVLRLGVHAKEIIYANPCKQPSHIRHSASQSVNLMTFDSHDELDKIEATNSNAKLVLRLYVDDTKAICRLGTKFGAMLHDVPSILSHAKTLGLDVVGVSFHVGSGCYSVSAYSDAVKRARTAFDIGANLGFSFELLDIGGGFPGTENGPITFKECAQELATSLEKWFPRSSHVQVISEPGRFFAASTHTLAACVIGRKVAPILESFVHETVESSYMYFINDGLYGSFNCLIYDHPDIQPVVLATEPVNSKDFRLASIWGPTCDGMDCIMKDIRMPQLRVGQWICFPSMGAYTCAAGSDFNGFAPPAKLYIDTKQLFEFRQEMQFSDKSRDQWRQAEQ
uniref:ornithine decarboxylase n=1 Tax=Albugo laibachii Nc14 TaxID=890382 RepID=F0WV66_9STRA|nr:ornithine decarboxylase 1 putative [Albugo laibachii Nc14]|eukprot:CCA25305.1 ornithine decarboxylase 1 putative [Albugo laibachii Nc14]